MVATIFYIISTIYGMIFLAELYYGVRIEANQHLILSVLFFITANQYDSKKS
jgi:hypothetical protein